MGGRGAAYGSKGGSSVAKIDWEQIDWKMKCSMSLNKSYREVNELLKDKKIETNFIGEHSTGLIKFNSNARGNILCNAHSNTSEKKWVVQKFQENFKSLNVKYDGFEELRLDSHNLSKKLKRNYQGFNRYRFEYKGKKWEIKTAVVGNNWHEEPYFIKEIDK